MRKPHIENILFWNKLDRELINIIDDCREAIKAIPNNPKNIYGARNYSDQINDAHTVLKFRSKDINK
jgi:hypothetical protein